MTLVIWAAGKDFALLMADRRVYNGRVVATQDGQSSEIGELSLGEDRTKAIISDMGRGIFGVSGIQHAFDKVERVRCVDETLADRVLHASLLPSDLVGLALDGAALPTPNAILHAYSRAGRMICSRFQWATALVQWEVMVAPRDQVAVAAIGSGTQYVQSIATADGVNFNRMQALADDPMGVRAYLSKVFRAVHAVDPGVGADIDSWLLDGHESNWKLLKN